MKTQPTTASPCTPISQVSGAALPVVLRTEITTFIEDYQQPDASQATHTAAADLRVIKCVNRFDLSASNPHPSSVQAQVTKGPCLTEQGFTVK